MKISYLISLSILFSALINYSDAQSKKDTFNVLQVIQTARIKEAQYKIVQFRQSKDEISNIALLDRRVTVEEFNNEKCLKIIETANTGNSRNKVVCYVDLGNLRPKYMETASNDTLAQKYIFENNKIICTTLKDKKETVTEMSLPENTFLSNSFSEIVQSVDFKKYSNYKFATFSPGRPSNIFIVSLVGKKTIIKQADKKINCWLLKFTRIDSSGHSTLGGYRYVDETGKILLYKSDIGTDTFFAYQLLMDI